MREIIAFIMLSVLAVCTLYVIAIIFLHVYDLLAAYFKQRSPDNILKDWDKKEHEWFKEKD